MFKKLLLTFLFITLYILDGSAKSKSKVKLDNLIYVDIAKNQKSAKDESVIMILLDASGSMSEKDQSGNQKIDSAKKTINTMLRQFQKNNTSVGLMAFNTGCEPATLLVDPLNKDFSKIKKTVDEIRADGSTPLASSIHAAGEVLKDYNATTRLIVISDGGESCGGDPVFEAQQLRQSEDPVFIDVIAYGTNQQMDSQLRKLGNRFHIATDYRKLFEIVNNIMYDDSALARFVRDDQKEVVSDRIKKLMWQDNGDVKINPKGWQEAIDYCEHLSLAGFDDWRLPTIDELISITNDKRHTPAIVKKFENTNSSKYWSSTSYVDDDDDGWFVHFQYGNNDFNEKSMRAYSRCVRDNK